MTDALVDGLRTDVVIDTGSHPAIGITPAAPSRQALKGRVTILVSYARRHRLTCAHVREPMEVSWSGWAMSQLRLSGQVTIDFDTRKVLFDLPPRTRAVFD